MDNITDKELLIYKTGIAKGGIGRAQVLPIS